MNFHYLLSLSLYLSSYCHMTFYLLRRARGSMGGHEGVMPSLGDVLSLTVIVHGSSQKRVD